MLGALDKSRKGLCPEVDSLPKNNFLMCHRQRLERKHSLHLRGGRSIEAHGSRISGPEDCSTNVNLSLRRTTFACRFRTSQTRHCYPSRSCVSTLDLRLGKTLIATSSKGHEAPAHLLPTSAIRIMLTILVESVPCLALGSHVAVLVCLTWREVV